MIVYSLWTDCTARACSELGVRMKQTLQPETSSKHNPFMHRDKTRRQI